MSDNNGKPSITGYKLMMPDKQEAFSYLCKAISEAEAENLWVNLCNRVGLPENTEEVESLCKIFKLMAAEKGRVGVMGRTLSARANSYKVLSKVKGF